MEKFIRIDENNKVTFMHNLPFDATHGMKKTREQLLEEGKLVTEIATPENIEGKYAVAMYDPDTNSVYYVYEDAPLTDSQRIDMIEDALNELLMGGLE